MRKKLLSALLAFCMVLTLLPTTALAAEGDPERGYYGNKLSDEVMVVYDALHSGINQLALGQTVYIPIKTQVTYGGYEAAEQELSTIFSAVSNQKVLNVLLRDYPELFWLANKPLGTTRTYIMDRNNQLTNTISSNGLYTLGISFTPNLAYSWTPNHRNLSQDIAAVKAAVTTIANAAKAESNNVVDQLRYVHDWLVDNNEYNIPAGGVGRPGYNPNYSAADSTPWTPVSALNIDENLKPVCEGYSRSFKLICEELGVPCVLVSSKNHMWNYVQIGEGWYMVDVTYDDPIYEGEGNKPDTILHDYFLIGSTELAENDRPTDTAHVKDTEYNYPDLSAVSYEKAVANQASEVDPASINLTAGPIVYGNPLSASTLTNAGSVLNKNGGTLTGTWTWQNGTAMPSAGTYNAGVAVFTYSTSSGSKTYIHTGSVPVTVNPKSLNTATVVVADGTYVFDNSAKTPAVTVTLDGTALTANDYDVAYTNNTNAGTATITVTGKGNYTDTANTTFVIQKADSATPVDLGTKTARVTTDAQAIALTELPNADFSNASVDTTNSGIFSAAPEFNSADNSLSFTLNSTAAEGSKAEVTISGTSANYVAVPVKVTIEVRNKEAQAALTISGGNSVTVGETLTLAASGGTTNNPVIWTVNDSSIATINNGVLTGVSAGTVTVTAAKPGDDIYADVSNTITITVNAANSGLTVTPAAAEIHVGDTVDLVASGGAAGDTRTVNWSVSDTSLAVLSEATGNTVTLTALKDGAVTVTAEKAADGTYEAAAATARITITKTDSNLIVRADNTDVNVRDTVNLTASGGAANDTRTITWTVDDPDVAELSASTGNRVTLTTKKEGTVTVTASKEATDAFDADSDSVTITVSKIKQNLEIISDDNVTLDDTLPLKANLDGVTWTVTNNTGRAEINGNNILHPEKIGIVTVTATKAGDDTYETATDTMEIVIRPFVEDVMDIVKDEDIVGNSTITVDTVRDNNDNTILKVSVTTDRVSFRQLIELLEEIFFHSSNYKNGTLYYYSNMEPVVNKDDSVASYKDLDYVWIGEDDKAVRVTIPAMKDDDDSKTYYISIPGTDNGDVIPNTRHAERGDRVSLSIHPDKGYRLDSLTVTDARGREISLRYSDDDTCTFTMPSSRVTVEAEFVKIEDKTNDTGSSTNDADDPANQVFTGLGTPGISGIVLNPSPMPFTDVRSTDWFYNNVNYVWKHYLMSGTSDTVFAPNLTTSRGMIWTILARMNNVRTDVNPGSTWYERGQLWAMEQGVTDGTNPMQEVTREQLVTMLWRNAGSPGSGTADLSQFSDAASVSAYAQSAVRWAVGMGVLTGSNGKLDPHGTATRAQVAAMVARYGDRVA